VTPSRSPAVTAGSRPRRDGARRTQASESRATGKLLPPWLTPAAAASRNPAPGRAGCKAGSAAGTGHSAATEAVLSQMCPGSRSLPTAGRLRRSAAHRSTTDCGRIRVAGQPRSGRQASLSAAVLQPHWQSLWHRPRGRTQLLFGRTVTPGPGRAALILMICRRRDTSQA
jgi:hypothetical protein